MNFSYKNNNIYKEKPKYNVPIDKIEKEIKDKNNKINEFKNNFKKIIDTNLYCSINNDLSTRLNNHNNYDYYGNFKLFCLNNCNLYNTINNYNKYIQLLTRLIEQQKVFQQLKELGLYYLTSTQNHNNYLLNIYINNVNNNNFNNIFNNPFIFLNNNLYNNFNNNFCNYRNRNPLLIF